MLSVCIVDDERVVHETLNDYLGTFCKVFHAKSKEGTLSILQNEKIDLVFLDIDLGESHDGITILKAIKHAGYHVHVVMLTQSEDKKFIRESLAIGAFDYLRKPIDRDELGFFLTKIKIRKVLDEENNQLRKKLIEITKDTKIIGMSYEIREILAKVERLRGQNQHVLILG